MVINNYIKDCSNNDFRIRILALKNLASLKSDYALQFSKGKVVEMMDDLNYYVRRTAIISTLKIYYVDNTFFDDYDVINKLYNFIKDPNSTVVQAAISALNEVMGGIKVNSKIIIYLLNRIHEFDSYLKAMILDLLYQYEPQDDDERFCILNICEDFLKSNNSALIIPSIKIFILYTSNYDNLKEEFFKRIKDPLITLISSSLIEIKFVAYKIIYFLILNGGKKYFINDYKYFFINDYDPDYIQNYKLNILKEVASNDNINNIIEELRYYY